MKILWSRELPCTNPWEPEFRGVFSYKDNEVTFYYNSGHAIWSVCIQNEKSTVLSYKPVDVNVALPTNWRIIEAPHARYLLCSEEIAINLDGGFFLDTVSEDLRKVYRKQFHSPYHFIEDSFAIGDYTISHKGEWGYTCEKDGVKIWDFSGRAYLYTDILQWNNRVYFGTAGQGGYFYILDLESGQPILSLRTGGTVDIKRRGAYCYLYAGKQKPQVVCVDLASGKVCDSADLPGKLSGYDVLGFHDDKLYTITFQYKEGRVSKAIFSCVSIDE